MSKKSIEINEMNCVLKMSTNVIISFIIIILNIQIYANDCKNLEFYNIYHFSGRENSLNSYVNAIYQDSVGYMWFSTDNGLVNYDGYKFKKFYYTSRNKEDLESNVIYEIIESEPYIYLLCTKDGLIEFNYGTLEFNYMKPFDSDDKLIKKQLEFRRTVKFNKNFIIFRSNEFDIFAFNIKTKKLQKLKLEIKDNHSIKPPYTKLFLDSENKIWAGSSSEAGVFYLNVNIDKMTIISKKLNFLENESVYDITEDNNGNLYFCTNKYFYKYIRTENRIELVKTNQLSGYSCYVDSENMLWVGFQSSGLGYVNLNNSKEIRSFNNYFQLQNEFIGEIYQDREGSIWVGTGLGGVLKFNKLNSHVQKVFNFLKGRFEANHLENIEIDENGNFWISSTMGGIYKVDLKENKIRHFKIPNDILCFFIYDMKLDGKSNVFVTTSGNGMYKYNKNKDKFDNIFPIFENSLESQYIHSFEFLDNGKILAGARDGLYLIDKNTGNAKKLFKEKFNSKINVIHKCSLNKNCFYLGTEKMGLFKLNINTNKLTKITSKLNDEINKKLKLITDIQNSQLDENLLLISTIVGGLIKYNIKDSNFEYLVNNENTNNNHINSFIQDNNNNVWLCTDQEVFIYNPETKKLSQYYEINKLLEKNTLFKMFKIYGNIFVEFNKGIISIEPDNLYKNTINPKIKLTEIISGNKKGRNKKFNLKENKIAINYDEYLNISFSTFSYINSNSNKYKYKLNPVQEDWIELNNKNNLFFPKIEPGNYTLFVTGSNNDSVYSLEPYKLDIKVLPPFYRSWWFKIMLFIIFALVVYKIYIIQIKALEKKIQEKSDLNLFYKLNQISEREKEIIEQLMQDKTREEIGETLFISPHTVRNHVYRIYKKLNVKNQGELKLRIKEKFIEVANIEENENQ